MPQNPSYALINPSDYSHSIGQNPSYPFSWHALGCVILADKDVNKNITIIANSIPIVIHPTLCLSWKERISRFHLYIDYARQSDAKGAPNNHKINFTISSPSNT